MDLNVKIKNDKTPRREQEDISMALEKAEFLKKTWKAVTFMHELWAWA